MDRMNEGVGPGPSPGPEFAKKVRREVVMNARREQEEKEKQQEVIQQKADQVTKAMVLPVQIAWLSLFTWPGFHYIATITHIPSPSYLASFGLVAVVVVIGRVVRGGQGV